MDGRLLAGCWLGVDRSVSYWVCGCGGWVINRKGKAVSRLVVAVETGERGGVGYQASAGPASFQGSNCRSPGGGRGPSTGISLFTPS